MFKKILCSPAIFLFFILFQYLPAQGQESIRFKVERASAEADQVLKQQFSHYTLASLSTEEIADMLQSRDYFQSMDLEIDGKSYRFNLRARDLRAPHYKLRAWTSEGFIELPRSPNMTYYGFTHKGQYDVRITADEDFFYAMIIQSHDELYVEPARHLLPNAPADQFVIYWASDNLKKLTPDACGVHDVHMPSVPIDGDHVKPEQEGARSRACKVVQIALADDLLMYQQYGGVGAVENHNMAVINNVETNYDFEFNDDLQFSVVEIFVVTSAGMNPWTNSNDPEALLDDFTAWGPNGFSNTHDIGGLWTNRNFTGDVIGLAWVSTVCSNFKYHVLEDFSNNANLLRVLQAHEMGHNFSANHDATGSNTIMAPSVTNTNNWSAASITSINNKINQVSCLGPCGAGQPPVADFDANPTSGCAPLVVTFDDQSTNNPTSWNWTFEGGTPPTSNLQNPVVTFNNPGTWNVSLMVSNAQGSNSVTFTNFITAIEIPFSDFDYFIDDLGVDFTNQSANATSYLWNFGDGATSTQTNPFHLYAEDGVYTVTLTATNSCGVDIYSRVIEIITLPVANFSADITEGCDPIEVSFNNLSSPNAEYYSWSFPGGSPPTSFFFEPVIVYETPGTYAVTLIASNEAGDDIHTITNYITVLAQPVAEFSHTTNNLTVTFNSLGSVGNTYLWAFGDGTFSSSQNPVHTYAQGGVYQVSLTVSNDCGSDVLTLNVSVAGAPVASFSSNQQSGCAPLVVQFTNQSSGNPTSYAWVFQGGSPPTSNQANPLVTYNIPGFYDVQLTVTNNVGSDMLFLDNYIEVEFPTVSDFTFSVDGFNVTFINESSHATGATWYFGDGIVSDDLNPSHSYDEDGVYTVTLVSSGICGNDTSTALVTIQTPPQAGFGFQQMGGCAPATILFFNESSSNATSFAWTFQGGSPSSSNEANPTVVYTSAGTFSVSLIAFSSGGSDTIVWNGLITVGNVPNAAFLLSTNEMTITLNNQSSDAESYLWLFGDGQTSTEASPSHTYSSFGTYIVNLIATNSCGSDTMEVVIVLSTVPNAFFTYSAHTGCSPFEVQFIDQSQNNPTSWEWTFEGGIPSSSNLQNPIVTYNTPGSHTVMLRVENSEGSDVLVLHDIIRVGGIPDASFSYLQNDNIVSLEYPGMDYDSLNWSFGDGRSDNSLNPTAIYEVQGQYQISLIVYNPCGSDTSTVWVTITATSTNDPDHNDSGWEIRPNPFSDVLSIYGQPGAEGTVKLTLLDVHGRLISSDVWQHPSGEAIREIPAGHLPSGVILVLIQEERSRVVLKAVHE